MDSGASALIIHKPCINKNNIIIRKTTANYQFTVAGSISKSREAEIKLKVIELNVSAFTFTPFYVTTK